MTRKLSIIKPKGRPKKQLPVWKPKDKFQALDSFLVFDARFLDRATGQQLLRILPELVHVRRLWRSEFEQNGCVCCHQKAVPYGAGGFCNSCQVRIFQRMKAAMRKQAEGRDLRAEAEGFRSALTLRLDVAQRLFGE